MRLSLAVPLFNVGDDVFNASCVAAITLEEQTNGSVKLCIFLNGNKAGLYYSCPTREETREEHANAVAAWKAALSKLYE